MVASVPLVPTFVRAHAAKRYERRNRDTKSGSRSYWLDAYPFSGVTRGLDPRVHPLRKSVLQRRWIAGSSPAMTEERPCQPSCIHSSGNRFSMAAAPLTVVRRRDRAADYSRLAGDCSGLATGLGDAATPPCVELTPSGRPTTVTRRPGSSNRLATRLASSRVTASIRAGRRSI
jgi:hypothetical protein